MARWHSCNVLQFGPGAQRVWQFDGGAFSLNREQAGRPGDALPRGLVGKSWASLWQPKLNVAWLPPQDVFIRVAQFPASSPDELRSMVELQLERLSPIPVTQAVWTMHVLPQAAGNMQTVIVTIVARNVIETFLGKLEAQGFMADRLELPMVDQIQATTVVGNGAWIYPETEGNHGTALVAWWYGGTLHSVGLLASDPGPNQAEGLRDQLMQMAWAGELEGWLTAPPEWHLVGDGATAKDWESTLRKGLEQPVETLPPLSNAQTAALTARRSAQADPKVNLLPPEFATRYHQQFVDRLWLRGLGLVLGLYAAGVLIYFVALGVLSYQAGNAEQAVAGISDKYTNAVQNIQRHGILKEREDLKYAALECYEAAAEVMPEGLTLDTLNFSAGKRMLLSGTAPGGQLSAVTVFSGKLRKFVGKDGQRLFGDGGEPLLTRINGPNGNINWSFGVELKRGQAD